MAYMTNIARPYALAAFECACDKNQLTEWKAFFQDATTLVKDPTVVRIASNPLSHASKLYELFQSMLKPLLNTERDNFLRLVSQNKRLMVLPEMANSFNAHCEQLEKISKVRIVTAIPASVEFQKKITAALTKRIKRDVTLQCEVDPSILGGAIIHMGDNVIDGSIRGKLTRLLESSLR